MIKLHHLRVGRSIYTVWLLEELGLAYELEVYHRNDQGRAPPKLKGPHPLGKSPVIEDDGHVISESGAIAAYLCDVYGSDGPLAPPPKTDKTAYSTWLQWLHYPEGSGVLPLMMTMLLAREADPKPPVISAFAKGEVDAQLGYLEGELTGRHFICGDSFAAPDISLAFMVNFANAFGLLGSYPALNAYLERVFAREGWTRAQARAEI
ncbi:MAG: glutathione S-transferase family protein [Pseudomonadota bacterium]